ncbi:MAG: hypothetical protein ACFBSE_06330, partial [Prochloraceae cyanobacterium]
SIPLRCDSPSLRCDSHSVGTGLNLEFLSKLGCRVTKRNVVEICLEAGSRRQQDKWKLFIFCRYLQRTNQKITQEAIARGLNVSQGWISKLFRGESITWRDFIKLFQSLLKSNKRTGINDAGPIDDEFLREFLELDPIEAIEQSIADIKAYGWQKFSELLSLASIEVRTGILGMLAASIGLGQEIIPTL